MHALAKVIPFQAPRRHSAGRSADVAYLDRRYGERWTILPSDMGRDGSHVERLISAPPTSIDPSTVTPDLAAASLRSLISPASAVIDLLSEDVDLLGEALGVSLQGASLAQLRRVATATIAIAAGPTPDPGWAHPAAATVADAVLQLYGPLLVESRALHHRVYEDFTEEVWDLSTAKLARRRASWRFVGFRRKIARTSRTGKVTGTKDVLALIRGAKAARAAVADVQALLSIHLGTFDRGPLTDATRAADSLVTVVELHRALGDHLSTSRLNGLLRADAFKAREVMDPARSIRMALDAWFADADRGGHSRALELTLADLATWLEDAAIAADLLDEARTAATAAGRPPITVEGLVNDLLARERASERCAPATFETAGRSS